MQVTYCGAIALAPPPLIEVVPAIENAVVILKDQDGQVVSDVVETVGLTVRVEFNYTGSAEPPAEEWTPVRKAVNIKVGKVSKKNGRFVTFSSTVGRIQKVGKNSYAVESPITQSLKPNDYLVRGKLIKTKKYKGGDFVESSLTVIPAEDKVIE